MKKNNYKDIAKNVIDLEIKALKNLKKSINNSFNQAVDIITKCQSKVILCGVGKSGLIAAKISATFSSVGTPSFCLSANDCSHGDLGSITNGGGYDLFLLKYNSSGTLQWTKQIASTSGSEMGSDMIIDTSDNIYQS